MKKSKYYRSLYGELIKIEGDVNFHDNSILGVNIYSVSCEDVYFKYLATPEDVLQIEDSLK